MPAYLSPQRLLVWSVESQGALKGDWGNLRLLEARQGQVVQGTGREDRPLAAPGTWGCLDPSGREQLDGQAEGPRRTGNHMQEVVGNPHPVEHGAGSCSHRTLEGSQTWTCCLWAGKIS